MNHKPEHPLPWPNTHPTGKDAAYSIHAANAYPKLVTALLDEYFRIAFDSSGQHLELCRRLEATLKEVGEL